ncbi:WG repeat-containing protein [Bacillus bombysepticus]|uniref:WG repeat-containing protein n=1 Tax=Bacillus bombysepticus TaxID=658666 RepID=UPI003018275A
MKQQYMSLVEEEGRITEIKSDVRELGVIKMMNKNKRFGFIQRLRKPDIFFSFAQMETHIGRNNMRNQPESNYTEGTIVTFFIGEHRRNKKISALSVCELDYYLKLDKNLPDSFEAILRDELIELKKPSIKNVYEEISNFVLYNSPGRIMKDEMKKARWVSLLSVYKQSIEYRELNGLIFNSQWEDEISLMDIESFLFYVQQLDWIKKIESSDSESVVITRRLYQYFVVNGLSLGEYIKFDSKRFNFLLSMVALENEFGEFQELTTTVENQGVTPVIFNKKLGLVDNETYKLKLIPTYDINGLEYNSKRSFQKVPVSYNGLWGLWDFESNKLATECQWTSCKYNSYTETYTISLREPNSEKYKFGILDDLGMEIIPPIYDSLYYFEILKSYVVQKDGNEGLIDKQGVIKIGIDEGISEIGNIDENIKVNKDGLVGVYSKDGELVIPCKYEDICSGEVNFLKVKLYGKWGVLHKGTKNIIIPAEHTEYSFQFLKDYIGVKIEGLWAVYDAWGRKIVSPMFTAFSNSKRELYIRDLWSDRTKTTRLENGAFIYDPKLKQKGIIDLEKRIIKYENGEEKQV